MSRIANKACTGIADPRFLVAVSVLFFNDFILKPHWPSALSGKLSDFAGLIVFPVVLAALLSVARFAVDNRLVVGGVGIWFTAIQLSQTASDAHELVLAALLPWTPQNVADPTDLIALPMTLVALRILDNPRPVDVSSRARVLLLMVGSIACLADTGPPVETLGPVQISEEGEIEVLQRFDFGDLQVRRSNDDGQTFTVDRTAAEGFEDLPDTQPRQVCLNAEPNHCFRMTGSPFELEESTDGGESWGYSWANATDTYLFNEPGNGYLLDADSVTSVDSFASVIVTEQDSVLVTTGVGPLLRWTADDGWNPSARSLRSVKLADVLVIAGLTALVAFLVRQRIAQDAAMFLAVGGTLFVGGLGSIISGEFGFLGLVGLAAAGLGAVAALVGLVLAVMSPAPRRAKPIESLGFIALVVAALSLPVLAWFYGPATTILIPTLTPAVVLAIASTYARVHLSGEVPRLAGNRGSSVTPRREFPDH